MYLSMLIFNKNLTSKVQVKQLIVTFDEEYMYT